jgi:single-strand DNA-binding protein
MVNKVILVGNLGRDPEIRSLPSGQPVASFSIATSRKWRDKDGSRQEQTEWHNIVCFGKQAEIAGQYLQRGKQVFIEGRIHTNTWEDRQTGEKKYRTEIVCENFQMLGGGGARGDAGSGDAAGYGGSGGYGGGGGSYAGGRSGGYSQRERPSQGERGAEPSPGPGGGSAPDDYGPEPSDDDIPF